MKINLFHIPLTEFKNKINLKTKIKKMDHKPYFPTAIASEREWFVNYKAQIAIDGPDLGMTLLQIEAEQAACQAAIDEIDTAVTAQTAAEAANAKRNKMILDQLAILRPAIRTHKAYTGYTPAIGKGLKIIGSEITIDPLTVKTTMTLAKVPSGVDLKFLLENCEGGNIYSRRGKETTFTYLKTLIHPHGIDTRANLDGAATEVRDYYTLLLINDLEVGIPSNVTTINN